MTSLCAPRPAAAAAAESAAQIDIHRDTGRKRDFGRDAGRGSRRVRSGVRSAGGDRVDRRRFDPLGASPATRRRCQSAAARAARAWSVAALLALAGTGACAQYKVVGPDGRVTYTDRPPADTSLRVTPLDQVGSSDATPDAALPLALRRTAQRFPVTLYSSADCAPCDAARQLLQQRGIPYTERRFGGSTEDAEALERATGARTLPSLTIGAQALPGFEPVQWTSYLDAAGYPPESQLPKGWTAPAPVPLVAPKPAVAAAAPEASAPARTPTARARPAAEPKPSTSIRF